MTFTKRSYKGPQREKAHPRDDLPSIISLPIPAISELIKNYHYQTISKRKRLPIKEYSKKSSVILKSADYLTVLISLVYSFINDDDEYKLLAEKLYHIDSIIGEMELAIINYNYLDESLSDESEYVSQLFELARDLKMYDFEIEVCECSDHIDRHVENDVTLDSIQDEDEDEDEVVIERPYVQEKVNKALKFFVLEISRRTAQLANLCTGAVTPWDLDLIF